MAVIAAVNFIDKLVLLEDGRELPITGFYASSGPALLKVTDELRSDQRVDDWEEAEIFTVDIPGASAGLIVEMGAVSVLSDRQTN